MPSVMNTIQAYSTPVGVGCLALSCFPGLLCKIELLNRTLVNASWGALFGSHVYRAVACSSVLEEAVTRHIFGDIEIELQGNFSSFITFAASMLTLSVSAIVPHYYGLRFASSLCTILSIIDNSLVLPMRKTAFDGIKKAETKHSISAKKGNSELPKTMSEDEKQELIQLRYRHNFIQIVSLVINVAGFLLLIPYLFS